MLSQVIGTLLDKGASTVAGGDISAEEEVNMVALGDAYLLLTEDWDIYSKNEESHGAVMMSMEMENLVDSELRYNKISSGKGVDNVNIEVMGEIIAEVIGNDKETGYQEISQNGEIDLPEYIARLQSERDIELRTRIETHEYEHEEYSGLSQVGGALIAIAMMVATAGAGAAAVGAALAAAGTTVSAGTMLVMSAIAQTIITTAATTMTTSTINNGFDPLQGVEETVSQDSLENMAEAAAIAALTAGIGSQFGVSGNVNPNVPLSEQFKQALYNQMINESVGVASRSALHNEDIGDALEEALINIAINSVGQVASANIGEAAHGGVDGNGVATGPSINKTEQLLLHAGLGCAMGAAKGGDCASGAASGVTAELVAEAYADYRERRWSETESVPTLKESLVFQNEVKQLGGEIGGLAGSTAALVTGIVSNQSDAEIAKNIYNGYDIGKNSAKYNALDTISDALMVLYDAGKITYGYWTDDKGMVHEGWIDLTADTVALGVPFLPAGSTKIARAIENTTDAASTGTKLVDGGVGNNGPNDGPIKNVTNSAGNNQSQERPDFYVTKDGIVIPGTGYRAIGGDGVPAALNGNIMSDKPYTYITFDDIRGMSSSEIKDLLQLPGMPSYIAEFDTLQIINDIKIPDGRGGTNGIPEPLAVTHPEFTSDGKGGGGTQVITDKTIEDYNLTKIDGDN